MAKPHGPNIQAARERRGLSRRDLAQRVGRSYEWVFNLEKEHKTTPREKLYLLADVLDVPETYVERVEALPEPA